MSIYRGVRDANRLPVPTTRRIGPTIPKLTRAQREFFKPRPAPDGVGMIMRFDPRVDYSQQDRRDAIAAGIRLARKWRFQLKNAACNPLQT